MPLPKNALAFPPNPKDYNPASPLTTACFMVIGLLGWVTTWVTQMLFSYTVGLTMSQKRKEYWCGYLFRLIAASPVVNLTPGVSVRVTSDSYAFTAAQIKGQSPVMVICNHRSYADPFVLAAALLPLETKYVAKSDLFKVPFGGWAMKRAGDLAVHFDAKRAGGWGTVKGSTGQLLAQAAAHFEAGNSICIFPEGNRMGVSAEKCVEAGAHPSKLMLFKPPFFDLCKKMAVPVVCVSLLGSDEIWPVGEMKMRPADCVVHVHAPMHGKDYESDQAFCDACRMKVGEGYQMLCKKAAA